MDDKVEILIVGGHPDKQTEMEDMLEDGPYAIQTAHSEKEAIGLMLGTSFAVVIFDDQLAGMDGYAAVELVRSHEKTRDVPILLVTANDKALQQIFGDSLPERVDYLGRPFAPAILQSKVRILSELHCQGETIQAQRRLIEGKNRELEQFIYAASHDLREPLRVVTLYLELFSKRCRGMLDEKADSFIHYAVDGAERMDKLIKGLLRCSRVATTEEPFTEVDTNEVFEEARASLAAAIRDRGAVITKTNLPTLRGAHTLLVQLFRNLLSNAVKFGKPGAAPEVHVSADRRQRQWLFMVRDNGIGIESKHFERIFVVFQRLHTVEEYPGIGVGLALCRRIVERHQGRLWLESTPGEGSTFFFTLPAEPDGEHL